MKFKYYIATCLVGAGLLMSCKDDFAKDNSKPSDVDQPSVHFLFSECLVNLEPMDYTSWQYDAARMGSWIQSTVYEDGNTSGFNLVGDQGSYGSHVNRLLRMTNELRYQISKLNEVEKPKYEYLQYLTHPLLVLTALNDSDAYGSRQYTEAQQARYTEPIHFLPKYDTQEELFDFLLDELNQTIDYLKRNDEISDSNLGKQDFIYRGDTKKWAKLANSMKLKLAARLLVVNKGKALAIVKEAAQNPAGLITTSADDLIYNRGKDDNHWNNDFTEVLASEVLLNFMKENHDTRLLSVFTKNQYNGSVVQAFLDQNKQLPPYIEENAIIETVNGKKTFNGWKGDGEPWVRYYGAPLQVGAGLDQKNNWIFNITKNLFDLKNAKGAKVEYRPISYRNQEIVKSMSNFTYPDAPDTTPDKDTESTPWYGIFFSSAEVNLLLAEFKLLDNDILPLSAEHYFTEGIRQSAYMYDKVAELNKVPYYNRVSKADKFDKPIKITSQMVDEMLTKEAYKLTGSKDEQLEKVYIQQYIHYLMNPMDQYVNVRRSGVPMKKSSILAWQEFHPKTDYSTLIPRRFKVSAPPPSDQLYQITIKAWEDQNYSYGNNNNDPIVLNTERIWYDKNAPQFGAGPVVKSGK